MEQGKSERKVTVFLFEMLDKASHWVEAEFLVDFLTPKQIKAMLLLEK